MNTCIKIFHLVLLVIGSCSSANVTGNGLRCSCELDKVHNQKIGIHCGKTSNGVSTSDKNMISCEKEVLGSVPRGYKYVEGFGLYKIHRTVKDYAHAVQFCEYEGASLFVPESAEEVRKLAPLFKDNPTAHQVFVGINDIAEEGKFVTLKGFPLTSLGFQTWKSGQPDNWREEDCLTLTDEGELNDESCSSWQAFLCKRVTNVPRRYQYVEGFGFYKLYQLPNTFKEAKKRCERDGGFLCVPDTYDEADILIRFYDADPNVHDGWVGISDIKQEGHFVTKTGKPLSALQFQNWGKGEPNSGNAKGEEDCVGLHEAGILADYNCDDKKPYTCEIPLDL